MTRRIEFDTSSCNRQTLLIVVGALLVVIVAVLGLFMILGDGGGEETPISEATATHRLPPTASPTSLPVTIGTPTETLPPAPTATLAPYQHVVQEGETLFYIIQIYGYRDASVVPEILLLNGMGSPDDVTAGQTLLIPQQTPTPAPTVPQAATVAGDNGGTDANASTPTPGAPVDTPAASQGCEGCTFDNRCTSPDGGY